MNANIHNQDYEEKQFIQVITDAINRSSKQNRPIFGNFYNKAWALSVLKDKLHPSVATNCHFFGGYDGAERQMIGVYDSEIDDGYFPIAALRLTLNVGIGKKLGHRDYLGSVLGLGIKRDVLGDIMLNDDGADIIIKENMTDYIENNLLGIAKYKDITITQIDLDKVNITYPEIKEYEMVVASLRLDVILSAGFGVSRSISEKLIKSEKVKCNGATATSKYKIQEGDIIAVRGYGKFRFAKIRGLTKKDRLQITIEKYI